MSFSEKPVLTKAADSVYNRTMARKEITRLIKRSGRIYDPSGHGSESVLPKLGYTRFILGAVISVFAIFYLIMNGIRTDAALAEKWTVTVGRAWENAIGHLTSFIPVSIFEILVVLLITVGLFLFVRLVINLCHARFKRILTGLLSVGTGVMYVLNLYMLSMGFGYYRAALPLGQAGDDYDAVQAKTVALYFLDDFNALAEKFERDENGCVVSPYSFGELAEIMKTEYSRVANELDPNGYFFSYTPTAKRIVNSWFMSDLRITGITFLPTGESNVNISAPPSSIPFTMAHELAHAKGVQREGDANLIAQYLLLSSDDDYLRYCGYYDSFYAVERAVWLAGDFDGFKEIAQSVTKTVVPEYAYDNMYWNSQPDIIGDIGEFFNDIYLKLNGAINGTGSYGDGNQSGTKPSVDPNTGETVIKPVYSQIQKIYFYLYEYEKSA